MTYEEAISMKNAIGEYYIYQGQKLYPRVTPYKEKDDIKFLSVIKNKNDIEKELNHYGLKCHRFLSD